MPKGTRRTHGDGGLYQRADGLWIGTVELPPAADGKRRRKVVSSKTQAGALAKLRQVRRDVETHGDMPTTSSTVEAWLTYWLANICAPTVKPRTLDGYAHKVGLINEAIGQIRLDKLSADHVRKVHRHAEAPPRGRTTAIHCHRVLKKALKDAQRQGVVLRNAADLVDTPREKTYRAELLTAEQSQHLLRTVQFDPLAARWALALYLGARQGEALGLTWDCIDYDAGTIAFVWQLQRLTWRHGCGTPTTCGHRRGADCPRRHHGLPADLEYRHLESAWFLTRPKWGSARLMPLSPFLEALLRQRYDIAAAQPNPHGLVFARPDGRPFDPALDSKAWHAWLKAAGLPNVTLHSARHTAATQLLAVGVEEATRMEILGHNTVTAQRMYAHGDLAQRRQALALLEAAIKP